MAACRRLHRLQLTCQVVQCAGRNGSRLEQQLRKGDVTGATEAVMRFGEDQHCRRVEHGEHQREVAGDGGRDGLSNRLIQQESLRTGTK